MNIRAQILAEILTPQQMLELEERLKGFVDLSLEEFLIEFISAKSKTASPSYLRRSIRPTVNRLLQEFTKEKPISNISSKDAEDFILEIFNKSPHSARLIHRVCRAIWNWGIRREYIAKNVFTHIKLPRHQKSETITISEEHFTAILNELPLHLRDLIIVLKHTGLRPSELNSMRWKEIHLRKKIIIIGSKSYITKTKRIRYVPMSSTVENIIKTRKRNYKDQNGLVFCKTNGFPYPVDYISKVFKRACKKLKLSDSYHLYSLRATFGSELISKGIPIATVSKILGNSIQVCEQHYLSFDIDCLRKAVECVEVNDTQ